jgi:multiple sugar transport system substrate-binding protein
VGLGLAVGLSACGGGGEADQDTAGTSTAEETGNGDAGDGGGEATEAIELSMLAPIYSDATKTLWEGFISDFEKANPTISINLEMQSWENIGSVIATKVQAGQAPDILSKDAFTDYVKDDLLYSADEILSPETIADFQDSFVANASMDGKQYGMPLIASARALFLNDDIFAEAGLDPSQPPATWEELKADAKKITDLDKGYYGYGMPLGSEEAQGELAMWAFTNGGSYGDATELTLDAPANVEAAEFMQGMIEEGLTQPDAGATQRTPMINNVFFQGKMGMAVGLPPFIGMIASDAPDLHYTIVPFPSNTGEKATLGVADHLMVFNNGDEAKGKAAGAFLDFFYQPENYVKFVDTEGFLPTTKSGAEQTTKTEFKVFNELLPVAKFYPFTNPDWQSAQTSIQKEIGGIAQGKDPAELLASIQQSVGSGL